MSERLDLDAAIDQAVEQVKASHDLEPANDINDGLPRPWRNAIHALYRLEVQTSANLYQLRNEVQGIREQLGAARGDARQLAQGGVLFLALVLIGCTVALCVTLALK